MEPINMLEQHLNLFPAKFCWQGRVYQIDSVTECKTITNPLGRSEAYHFWVRCEGKSMHLSQMLASGQWVLQQD